MTIPELVTTIGRLAFFDCSSLTNVTIPESVTTIGNEAFSSCSSLTSVTIPESVTTIGEAAFSWCTSLTSVTIPESVITIGYNVFSSCTSLTSVTIPESVTTISNGTFSYCTSLTSMTIPEWVTTIGNYAFYNCTSLTSVTIPESVTTIGDNAFSSCTSLTSINIPKSVTYVGISAFENCISLENATISGELYMAAFRDCSNLTKIVFTETASIRPFFELRFRHFQWCTSIKDIIIEDGDNALTLYSKIFEDAPVENLYVGRNMDAKLSDYDLTKNIFGDNENLKKVVFGSKVTSLGDFGIETCENITNITSLNPTPPAIDDDFFTDEQYSTIKLDVPESSISLYKQSKGWRHFYNEGTTSMSKIESAAKTTVTAGDGCIMVSNAKGTIRVYTPAGTLVKSATASGDAEIAVPGHGVYIVKTGGETVKVAL